MRTVGDVVAFMRELAPEDLAESWDRVGLQAGSPEVPVERVLLCLDATEDAVARASAGGARMIVAHHPLIFHPPTTLREDRPEGRLLCAVVRAGLSVYAAHTNLDVAAGGVNDCLADALGLVEARPLEPIPETAYKLAVFVPVDCVEPVMAAMAEAGAGRIGAYSHCSFRTPGTGTYLPLAGASPYAGQVGSLERAEEVRLEMIVPGRRLPGVTAAMVAAHPYEEVAYDVYPLQQAGDGGSSSRIGLGRVGRLAEPLELRDLVDRVRGALNPPELGVVGDPETPIESVAVLGGSGGRYVRAAHEAGAQAFVTSEVGHHDRLLARDLGLAVLDAGHEATERVVLQPLAERLSGAFPDLAVSVAPATFPGPSG